jgi:preprotein translocase subunit SecG
MISKIFIIIQLVLSVLLTIAVLLQQRGSGLGAAFGGSSNIYSTKRGIDKLLFRATIGLSILFLLVSIVSLLV